MTEVIDETYCSPLCQHPSCWASQRRLVRGIPQCSVESSKSDSEDEGLPTQKIVNLLDDYGEDPRDRFPSRPAGGQQLHSRMGSMHQLERVTTRDSYPKVRVPNATPASPLRSSGIPYSRSGSRSRSQQLTKPKEASAVEVQEVFDLSDLHSDWHDTFKAKRCYVWVPNPNRKPKQVDPTQSIPIKQLAHGPETVGIKDMTEMMVPREVEWEREKMTMKRPGPDRSSPTGGQPYPRTPASSGASGIRRNKTFYGLYDLLDLPKDVLMQILRHIDERDMLDPERFAHALLRALPKLEQENTTVSLAYGNVLQQHKVNLQDGSMKTARQLEPLTGRQVYLLEDESQLARMNRSMDTEAMAMYQSGREYTGTLSHSLPDDPRIHSTPREGLQLNKKPILPSIPVDSLDEDRDESSAAKKSKVASISLGLPTIPSGVKYTRPFHYNKQELDFSLGPVHTPPASIEEKTEEPDTPTDSGQSTERSSIHVTMPTVPTERDDLRSPLKQEAARQSTMDSISDTTTTQKRSTNEEPAGGSTDREATYRSATRDNMMAPVNTPTSSAHVPRSATRTPETTGLLGTIHESVQDAEAVRPSSRPTTHPKSRGGRSVHFAPELPTTPAQPPSSPTESERTMTSASQSTFIAGTSISVNYPETMASELESLMVIGRGAIKPVETYQSRQVVLPPGSPFRPGIGSSPSMSPELWPQVDEEAYKMMSPSPSPNKSTRGSNRQDIDLGQAMASNYEYNSEKSEMTSMMPHPGGLSRESSVHSERLKKMMQEGNDAESPAPPPPSPELVRASQADRSAAPPPPSAGTGLASRETSNLGVLLEEGMESESDYTISAKPPSNLDDISRFNTPCDLQPRGVPSREGKWNQKQSSESDSNGTQAKETLINDAVTEMQKLEGSRETPESAMRQDQEYWAESHNSAKLLLEKEQENTEGESQQQKTPEAVTQQKVVEEDNGSTAEGPGTQKASQVNETETQNVEEETKGDKECKEGTNRDKDSKEGANEEKESKKETNGNKDGIEGTNGNKDGIEGTNGNKDSKEEGKPSEDMATSAPLHAVDHSEGQETSVAPPEVALLDQFDAKDEEFKEELKKELDKLS